MMFFYCQSEFQCYKGIQRFMERKLREQIETATQTDKFQYERLRLRERLRERHTEAEGETQADGATYRG